MRRYGREPFTHREDKRRCVVQVVDRSGWHWSQCARARGHGKDGLLCTQHAKKESAGRYLDIPEDKEEA